MDRIVHYLWLIPALPLLAAALSALGRRRNRKFSAALAIGSMVIMCLCGKVVVAVDGDEGRVFAGVGSVGWTRRFVWGCVTAVEETAVDYNGQSRISLISQTRLTFGTLLTDCRRHFVLQGLRKLLATRDR